MRWLLIALVWLVWVPAVAHARPKVAVEPLDGDEDGRYADAIVQEAGEHAKVIGPKPTAKAADQLGITDLETPRSLKKLRRKLEVDAIIHGKVERSGGKKHLVLSVSGRGKRGSAFELETRSATSKAFRKELREELAKRIAPASDGDANEDAGDDEAAEAPNKARSDDDDRPKKKLAAADDDSTRARKHSDDDEDRPRKKKKKHHGDDDEGAEEPPPPRHPATQAALWLDAGPAGLHRTLDYTTTGVTPPPAVGTASISGQIEGEVYPGSFDSLHGAAAGFGVFGAAGKTVGLSITVPGTTKSAPINEMHYEIGARYRFTTGQASYAFGVAYWARKFVADRSGLMGATLDMPDVDYKGIAPGAVARFAATPTIGVGVQLEVPLMSASGQITDGMTGFGQASIYAIAAEGTVDVVLGPHYGLRFAALFDQVGLSFQTPQRGVTNATDRSLGVTGTFAVMY
ncbi:MAG: hypothetical protein ACM31C_24560 [Acidobacteriota bacterium]